MDVLLVKHYFSDVDSGYYVALSSLAKILFFATVSISQVMFPKVSELYQSGKKHKPLLYKSLLVSLIIIVPSILVFYLFPKLVVTILFLIKCESSVPDACGSMRSRINKRVFLTRSLLINSSASLPSKNTFEGRLALVSSDWIISLISLSSSTITITL